MEKFEFTNLSKILAIYAQDINALIRNISHTMQKLLPEVLVRDKKEDKWVASIFSYEDKTRKDYKYYCIDNLSWRFCISYEGNEHLLRTTNES